MQHYWSLESVSLQGTWLTIGSFDGVHIGHQAIIRELVAGAHAANAPAAVLTFHPHPATVLRNQTGQFYLSSPEERAARLGELGIDVVITHPFNRKVAETSAADFMADLKRRLDISHLRVGHDFALGHGREGNLPTLRHLGQELGFTVDDLQPVEIGGETVSSRRIRIALAGGDVGLAERLLGRPYRVSGQVVPGDGRGKQIGVPTANLDVWQERMLPKVGVYVCRAQVGMELVSNRTAVTNIGFRPTFDGQGALLRLETHLLDFDLDLYGQQVQLDFIARLRDEQRFPNVQALVSQIQQDIKKAREILLYK